MTLLETLRDMQRKGFTNEQMAKTMKLSVRVVRELLDSAKAA